VRPHAPGLPRSASPRHIEARGEKESRRDLALSTLAVALAVTLVSTTLLSPAAGGLAMTVFAAVALAAALPGPPPGPFGMANRITLLRGGAAAVFAGLALDPAPLAGAGGWIVAGAGALCLALDGVDGWFARREGLATPYGARFDMEVDAFTMLALCALLLALGKAGPWILAIGLMRYAFLAAGTLAPRLARPLPPSNRRRTVCAIQVGVLTLLLVPPLAPPLSGWIAAAALALLAWSFGRDLARLARP
jgi:phosphatidylglycerophosphate synthase